ncbi:GyrI-like domain-containing protein [Haloflavibacter putidus]|uniref:AraC family transcriptional regulator n=1 Tax=Haloflavibacter putidus TaxID=2576776 RepID=A0A507ZRH5_9FLAO|nr:GyrI-like domain-containing protein [Haloflavibacter putidus]TQD38884.1 AraC family transcriptional regulator [Haloflavibacter putidus]
MKIFKYVFFLLLILIIGGSIYIATLEGNYRIEKQKTIAAPPEMVFNQINQLQNWEDWAVWLENKSEVGITYEEITKGQDAKMSWTGTSHLDGSLQNTAVYPTDSLTQKLAVNNSSAPNNNIINWKVEASATGTNLQYTISGERGFTEKAMQLLQDSTFSQKLEVAFTQSLDKLEKQVQEKMAVYSINVDGVTQHSGGFYMYLTTAARNKPEVLRKKMLEMYPQVSSFMEENNIQKNGSPFLLYNEINKNSGTVIISACIPTSNKVVTPVDSDVLNGFMESKKVLKTTLKGNYKNMEEAWQTAENYIKNNSLQKLNNAQSFVVFVSDSRTEVNPANWVTEIYIPVKEIATETASSTELLSL